MERECAARVAREQQLMKYERLIMEERLKSERINLEKQSIELEMAKKQYELVMLELEEKKKTLNK